jgi:hypothetical protein
VETTRSWKCQKCLPKNAAGNEYSQFRSQAKLAINSKAIGVGLPKALGAHILLPCAPDVGHGAIGFNV